MEVDTACLFGVVACDPEFDVLLQNLKCREAGEAVVEAFNVLHSLTENRGQLYLSPKGCLVVSLLQQLLVRLLTKRLMNLMTAEALILHRNKIPRSYLKNYLDFQAHFSLKEVITKYHSALQGTE